MRLPDHIRRALRDEYPPPETGDSGAFWTAFRRRAAERPQHVRARRNAALRWPAVAAAAAALVLAVSVYFREPPEQAVLPAAENLSTVAEVDVFVDYGSLMIVQDTKHGGTLVWFAGLEDTRDGG